jgi:hypothetical protein
MGLIILLMIAGILLILAELLIIPGVGIAGILGALSLAGSCYYAFAYIGVTAGIIVTSVNVVLVAVLLAYALNAKTWKRFELNTVIDSKAVAKVNVEPGMRGKAVTRLAPIGTAYIADKNCEVTSLEGIIDAGSAVEVARVESNKIYVRIYKAEQ